MNSSTIDLERRVSRLPREIEPDRDLWPEIRMRLGQGQQKRPVAPPRLRRWLPLAMAASLLVAVSSTVTVWLVAPVSDTQWESAGYAWQDPGVLAARYAGAVDAEFGPARLALRNRAGPGLELVPPETRDRIVGNLREIDSATVQIRSAIGRDPDAVYLVEMLVALYAQEMNILTQLNQMTLKLKETQS